MSKEPNVIIPQDSSFKKILLFAIALILICAISFFLIFPLLGIAFVMSSTAWGIIIGTIILFSLCVLLFFIIPGILIVLISMLAFIWVVISIALFPFLFPLIIPVFIILLFIAYAHRKRK